MVQLNDELIELLDEVAARRGLSRSALIRTLVSEGLRPESCVAIGEWIAAGYRRIPQIQPDEWGEVTTSSDIATEEVLARLDAEERDGDHGPW